MYYTLIEQIRLGTCTCIIILFSIHSIAQNPSAEPLLRLLSSVDESRKDSVYYELVKFYRASDPSLAKYYAHQTRVFSRLYDHRELEVKSYNALGYLYNSSRHYDSALYFYRQGILQAVGHFPVRLIYFYNDIGSVYENMDVYDSALSNYLHSYEIALQLNEYQDQAIANNNIGTIYFRLDNYQEAAKYYEQALTIKRRNNITSGLDVNMLNLAYCLNSLGRYEQSSDLLNEVIRFCKTNACDATKEPDIYHALGFGYLNQKMYPQAEEYFNKAITMYEQRGDERQLASSLVWLSIVQMNTDRAQAGERGLMRARDLAEKNQYKRIMRDCYEQLAWLYERTGQLELSLQYKNKFITVKDNLFNEKLANNLRELYVDAAQKQSQRIIEEKEDQIRRGRIVSILTAVVSVLTIGLSISLFINLRNNRTLKRVLEREVAAKTESLQRANAKLATVNTRLIHSQQEFDSLVYRTSHDIKGPLATLLGLSRLAIREFKDNPQAVGDYLDKIHKTGDSLNMLLSRMIMVNTIRTQPLVEEVFSVREMVLSAREESRDLPNYPLITFACEVDRWLMVRTDKIMLQLALAQLIRNSYLYAKTSPEQGLVRVFGRLSEAGDFLNIKVEDNGVGIDPSYRERVFELFTVASEMHGSGLGLFSAKTAIERMEGTIQLTRNRNPTVFEIRIPYTDLIVEQASVGHVASPQTERG